MKANEEHTHVLNAVNSDNFEKIYFAKLDKYFTYLDEINANAANKLKKTLLPMPWYPNGSDPNFNGEEIPIPHPNTDEPEQPSMADPTMKNPIIPEPKPIGDPTRKANEDPKQVEGDGF